VVGGIGPGEFSKRGRLRGSKAQRLRDARAGYSLSLCASAPLSPAPRNLILTTSGQSPYSDPHMTAATAPRFSFYYGYYS